jgi:WD40 repeat protein
LQYAYSYPAVALALAANNQVATGSHENVIDLFDVKNRDSPYHHRKRLHGHSSAITHLDWSADSALMQSNCAAYEILYWDAIKGTNLRATKDSTESDTVFTYYYLTF